MKIYCIIIIYKMSFHWAQFPINSKKICQWKALNREHLGENQYDCGFNIVSFLEKMDRETARKIAVEMFETKNTTGMFESDFERILFEADNASYKFEMLYDINQGKNLNTALNEIEAKLKNNHGIAVIIENGALQQTVEGKEIYIRSSPKHILFFVKINGKFGLFDPQQEYIKTENEHFNLTTRMHYQVSSDLSFILNNNEIVNYLLNYPTSGVKFILVCVVSKKRKRERTNVRKIKTEEPVLKIVKREDTSIDSSDKMDVDEEPSAYKKIRGSGKKQKTNKKRKTKNNTKRRKNI